MQLRYAEEFRELYVDHEGQKELIIYMNGTLRTLDSDRMIDLFSKAIQDNIKPGDFIDWIVPNFTTTKPLDVVVSKAMLMSTMQKYFLFTCMLECGIPKYTILGEKEDWAKIYEKLNYFIKLDEMLKNKKADKYNGELLRWANLLKDIITQFMNVFDGKIDLEFWNTICSFHTVGSGSSEMSGWIATFSCINQDGLFNLPRKRTWPCIDEHENAVTTVPVKINDSGIEYDCSLYAGLFGFETDETCTKVIPKSNYVLISNGLMQ